ncbi:MAG: glycosyltransferase family 39 protein [Sedimentisphaerales bacterium]|nr:glycosyltransferase family 39 protein [Sedimentisphaerales bacterium]
MDKDRLLKSDVARLGVLAGLCLALGVYLIATTVLISRDGVFYIGQAQGFAGDPMGTVQNRPPGYPFLLWVSHSVASLFTSRDSTFLWIYASQGVTLLCRVLALIPLYFLGKSLIGGARAFWALLILVALPYPAQYGSDVLRDWPYVMFLSFGVWLLYEALRRRAWWLCGLVGLDAAAGYLIQPASGQLVLYGLLGFAIVLSAGGHRGKLGPLIAAVLLVAGFAGPVLPYTLATGTWVPHQLKPAVFNSPPVITSVGGGSASRDPLEFEVREGELLEIGVEALDPQGDDLTFTLAAVPVGSRPVYQFRLLPGGAQFVTISEDEKNALLERFPSATREYGGIACYAYAQSDVAADIEPVHRFWSPVQRRHFYTILSSEKETIQAESPNDLWTYEGVAFYAFAEGRQPPDAVPVHRFWSEQTGYSWAVTGQGHGTSFASDDNSIDDGVGWYIHVPGEAPAGMSFEGMFLRWRPSPGQHGDYQVNIIVSDGELDSCQLVKVTVREGPAATAQGAELLASNFGFRISGFPGGWSRLAGAVDKLFDGFAESLMVFFLVPWGVGLYYRMRYKADRLERTLLTAVIVVNAGLILVRYVFVAPSMDRRYCLPLVALTIFYVPIGLEHIARWLSREAVETQNLASLPRRTRFWFHVLMAIGIGICIPKLTKPLDADKGSYVTAIRWLRENTGPDEVTAVLDPRLTFYAQRPGLLYADVVDPRRVDYVVKILDKGAQTEAPTGWTEELSVPLHDRRARTLVIYRTHRRKDR